MSTSIVSRPHRVNRGGSWYFGLGLAESEFRSSYNTLHRYDDLGLRLMRRVS